MQQRRRVLNPVLGIEVDVWELASENRPPPQRAGDARPA
jgi:hypothetical protein